MNSTPDKRGCSKMKKIDFHVHITNDDTSVSKSIENFAALCERQGLSGVCVLAAEHSSSGLHPNCNEKALEISRALGGSFAFAALLQDRDFVEQTKEYMDMGFRGIKLLQGKPSEYRYFGYGYEHPRYDAFFAYAEKNAIPLIIHNNDPARKWDITKVSETSIAKGRYYDETMPSNEWFFKVMENVLEKYPKLCAALAHMGFYSDNIGRATALMEKCPNLMMDMTPAPIIYEQLSETPDKTKDFIYKYQDRLFYGTDVANNIEGKVRAFNNQKVALMKAFYEGEGEYFDGKYRVLGMTLPETILEKIYYKNAMKFIGENADI